jgi:hypothetical protein
VIDNSEGKHKQLVNFSPFRPSFHGNSSQKYCDKEKDKSFKRHLVSSYEEINRLFRYFTDEEKQDKTPKQ